MWSRSCQHLLWEVAPVSGRLQPDMIRWTRTVPSPGKPGGCPGGAGGGVWIHGPPPPWRPRSAPALQPLTAVGEAASQLSGQPCVAAGSSTVSIHARAACPRHDNRANVFVFARRAALRLHPAIAGPRPAGAGPGPDQEWSAPGPGAQLPNQSCSISLKQAPNTTT